CAMVLWTIYMGIEAVLDYLRGAAVLANDPIAQSLLNGPVFTEGYVWQLVLLNKGVPWAMGFVVLGITALLVRPILLVEVGRAARGASAESDAAPAPNLEKEPHLGHVSSDQQSHTPVSLDVRPVASISAPAPRSAGIAAKRQRTRPRRIDSRGGSF